MCFFRIQQVIVLSPCSQVIRSFVGVRVESVDNTVFNEKISITSTQPANLRFTYFLFIQEHTVVNGIECFAEAKK